MGVLTGAVRREQPPSVSAPAEPGLAEESPRAGGRKRKVKERRPGATMGAPRGCRERPCAQLLPGRRGRTKAATAGSPLWARAGRQGSRGPGLRFIAALGFEVLRAWRSWASARRVGPVAGPGECLRRRRERDTLKRTSFFSPRLLASSLTLTSHLGVSLTLVPLASPLALSQGRLSRQTRACDRLSEEAPSDPLWAQPESSLDGKIPPRGGRPRLLSSRVISP